VIDAMADLFENDYANVHRGIHWLSERSTDLYEQARQRVATFIGAGSSDEIVFTQGTTAAINLVARSWGDANIRSGDEILLTEMEHHSNLVPWQQLAERTGARLRHVPIDDSGQLEAGAWDDLLTDRTRMVAVAGVSNVMGTINPIGEITQRAHAAGALVLVDAAQSVPHLPTDVKALGVDFLAFSGHKMLGPTGVGVLYGRSELLWAMPPFMGGGSMIYEVFPDRFTPADPPTRFEAGTPPIAEAIGLGAAIDYLTTTGLAAIEQHERALTIHAHEVLGSIAGVTILGPPPEKKAGIVSFLVDGIHAHDVAQIVDRYGVAVRAGHHCAQPLHERIGHAATTRASFYLYTTTAEIDRLGEAIEQSKHLFRRR
jgi:cysteine desulfurase/selenocysteine lyase